MDFFKKDSYSIEDINNLIINEVEENIHLDYKAAGALDKEDKKRTEITKDISAFANSDGGIIIYGVSEEDHKPKEISPIDGRVYTKEWLENVIQLIQPRIEDIKIHPIRINDIGQSIYVVKIPRSVNAPHMARDKRYYKRFNFKSEPMEDYEVKDLFNRMSVPKLKIEGCSLSLINETKDLYEYMLTATIANDAQQPCDSYKLNIYLNNFRYCNIGEESDKTQYSYTAINRKRLKLGLRSQETIYPNEMLDIGHIKIAVKKENNHLFLNNLIIDMILLFHGGQDETAYIPSLKKYVEGRDKINELLNQ